MANDEAGVAAVTIPRQTLEDALVAHLTEKGLREPRRARRAGAGVDHGCARAGNVLRDEMASVGIMWPVQTFITKTPAGEVVMVARIDPERTPESVWNMAAL